MADFNALFAGLPELLTTQQVADFTHTSRNTIYDWAYRPEKYEIPAGMLIKFGRRLLIRRDVLAGWMRTRAED